MTKQTKKEVKKTITKTEIIDKCIKTVEYLIAPVTAVLAIWGLEVGIYVSAFCGMLISILTFVKLFMK